MTTHSGPHPGGFGDTEHKGLLEDCTYPDCEARVRENSGHDGDDRWGVYCPHGQKIVERDPNPPDNTYDAGRIVDPWPCLEPDCTRERFEDQERQTEDDYWASLMEEVSQW
ncbi:hypothetical protein [Streptomyces sp. NPDC047981]|uniref:hypothetical protein n=1 Tax=Streptomyces sp. NPDC047981 TaxID=3154610 RepID=UPI00341F45DD